MGFRAKLFIADVEKYIDVEGKPFAEVKMYGVYDSAEGVEGNSVKENRIFGKWTPNATFTATIYNPNVIEQLHIHKEFYVDFTEAE